MIPHPDKLLPSGASRVARLAYWTIKYGVTLLLAYGFIIGLAMLFESEIAMKLSGGLVAITTGVVARWLWPPNRKA